MKTSFIVLIALFTLFCTATSLNAQLPAYVLYDKNGREISYDKMIKQLADADVVLFGEQHDNAISHWLELELTRSLYEKRDGRIILGAEMFETDNQLILDEYFSGMITSEKFEDEARLWKNYKTDYKPLVEFARDSGLRFVATNIPRRYANVVFKLGLDTLATLSSEALKYIAPLPLDYDTSLNCYLSLSGGAEGGMGGHGSPNLRDAQAVKDATMTWSILKNFQGAYLFLHFNGAYHSDNFESMFYFLKKAEPTLNVRTISTVTQIDPSKLDQEHLGKADYIICVDEDVTRTY